jgi:hypothetical protein
MPRDEDDRRVDVAGQLLLELEAIDVRQLDIEDKARREIGLRIGQIVRGGSERLGAPSERRQQLASRTRASSSTTKTISSCGLMAPRSPPTEA